MTDDKQPRPPGKEAEVFLERWSRRKARARAGLDEAEQRLPVEPPPLPDRPASATRDADAEAVLPDLDSLDADSDYSAFMAAGIDESLRRAALRKLFRSAKFNVIDGLDDYCRDYTQWEKLGGVVTADMRHQMQRLARLAGEQRVEAATSQADGTDTDLTAPARTDGVGVAQSDDGVDPGEPDGAA